MFKKKKTKYRRCVIDSKKAVWSDGYNKYFFCKECSEKWGQYLHKRLEQSPRWRKQWQILMDKFLKLEQKKINR